MLRAAVFLAAWAVASALLLAEVPAPAPVVLHTRVRRAFAAALADARGLAAGLRAQGQDASDVEAYRYFWFATDEPVLLASTKAAFQLHVNFLSRYSIPIRLHTVAPDLVRLDIDLPGWDRGTLEAALFVDPFFHQQEVLEKDTTFTFLWPGGRVSRGGPEKGKAFKRQAFEEPLKAGQAAPLHAKWLDPGEVKELRELLHTEVPVLCAEWFLAQSCKQLSARNSDQEGLGYYEFLDLKDRDDFFRLVVFDKKGAERLGKKLKAAQEFSKVSALGRQIDADSSQSGGIWVTLDPVDATGEGVVIRNLEEGTLDHKIEEWYGVLANGLPVTFLSNNEGVRQNNAPADLVGLKDDSILNESRDGRIHVHLACLRCHAGEVLKPIKDWVRETYDNPLALAHPDKKRAAKLQKQYFGDLEDKLQTDRAAYQKAFRRATVTAEFPRGLDAQRACEIYARTYHAYADDPVTLEIAARDLGVPADLLRRQLTWLVTEVKVLDARLAPLVRLGNRRGLPIARLTFEDSYELLMDVAHGVVPKLRQPRPRAKPTTPEKKGS